MPFHKMDSNVVVADSDELLDFAELTDRIHDIIDHSELRHNLKMQLDEVDFLRAMYYQEKEFVIDELVYEKLNNYVLETSPNIPPIVDFNVNITIKRIRFEIQVILPKLYPNVQPKIYARSNQLSRAQQNSLNNDLESFLLSLDRGTICIYDSILWVKDNLQNYLVDKRKQLNSNPTCQSKKELFVRYWIYSHHIYCKEKRKEIIALSRNYHITGFCLSGKPGIICGEGSESNCNEWWLKIRSMTWKKIICKKVEEFETENQQIDSFCKFKTFEEIFFHNTKQTKLHETHTDIGEFYRYLVKHDCEYIFKDYFGIEGKSPVS